MHRRIDQLFHRDATIAPPTSAAEPEAKTVPPAFEPYPRHPTQATPTRQRTLYHLHDVARKCGISQAEEAEIERIGRCPAQVVERIWILNNWLDAHPA